MLRLRTYRSSPLASQHIHYRRNSGSRPEPLLSPLMVEGIVYDPSTKFSAECFALRITNKNLRKPKYPDPRAGFRARHRKKPTIGAFDVGVLPLDATYTNSTSPLACGKDGSGSAGEPHKVLERGERPACNGFSAPLFLPKAYSVSARLLHSPCRCNVIHLYAGQLDGQAGPRHTWCIFEN